MLVTVLRKHGCDQSSRFVAPRTVVSNICFVQLERTLNVVCDVLCSVALPVDDAVVLQSAESRCFAWRICACSKDELEWSTNFSHTPPDSHRQTSYLVFKLLSSFLLGLLFKVCENLFAALASVVCYLTSHFAACQNLALSIFFIWVSVSKCVTHPLQNCSMHVLRQLICLIFFGCDFVHRQNVLF